MAKEQPNHSDKLGRPVDLGSIVAFPASSTRIGVGSIEKVHPKMVSIKELNSEQRSWRVLHMKYPNEVVLIGDIPETLMFLLKGQSK